MLDFQLHRRLAHPGQPAHALGRVELLAMQLARIQNGSPLPFDLLVFDSPQLLVFAADHGLADEGLSSWPQAMTLTEVQALLDGSAPVGLLARQHGFEMTNFTTCGGSVGCNEFVFRRPPVVHEV